MRLVNKIEREQERDRETESNQQTSVFLAQLIRHFNNRTLPKSHMRYLLNLKVHENLTSKQHT